MADTRSMYWLLLHSTLLACCTVSSPTPPSGHLRWNPPLEDAMGIDGTISHTVVLEYCHGSARCSILGRIDPPVRLVETLVSQDGRDAVVWYLGPDGRSFFRFFELVQGAPGSICSPLDEVRIRPYASVVRWVDDGGVLLAWSAGTSVQHVVVFDRDCWIRLRVGAPALEPSPDGRHLVSFPGVGTPLADSFVVDLYDLSTGRLLRSRRLLRGNYVTSIRWVADGVELEIRGASDDGTGVGMIWER